MSFESINLGKRIKYYRKAKGFSIKNLADAISISPSMLSQIETGHANPSINTIRLIAKGLEIPVFYLFMQDENYLELVVRKDERTTINDNTDDVKYQLLTKNLSGSIEFCMMELEPFSFSSDIEMVHIGEEVGICISGKLDVHLDGNRITLNEGDSIKIPAGLPHRWENTTNTKSNYIFAINPPSF